MLLGEELLLALDLNLELILGWQVGQVLGGEELVRAVEHREVGHVLVRLGVEHDAERRVVSLPD